ncbi:MAG: PDZ domain-containing protein [Akkermansiaceae bacterium]|nr:PDZ domain-containing protein [Akkermansiaceae bacterium]
MRPLYLLLPFVFLAACKPPQPAAIEKKEATPEISVSAGDTRPAPVDFKSSVVRVNSTQQSWNPSQPWEKNNPSQRRALAAIVADGQVLTTAEMVADATYLELESTDGTRFAQAKVIAVDYEVNLALLGAASDEEGKALFEGTTALALAEPPTIGQALEIFQVEDNGSPLLTAGLLQSIDITSHFLPNQAFLTYMVKASMQSAASSYSLPVLQNGKLVGILISYDAEDQISDVASSDIVGRFLEQAQAGDYKGFPSLGVSIARTEDASLRAWLKIPENEGGIYVSSVRKKGAAQAAGIQKGDVILAVDGKKIDRRGYYEHSTYGNLSWGHLVRGEKSIGDTMTLSILRKGEPVEIKATLAREEEESKLIPGYSFGKAPNFLVKGGFVFQELSRPLLEAFGEEWTSRAPLNLLDAYENPEKFEDKADRVIFLSGSIPTPATIGYERLRNLIVKKVNGKEIRNMKALIEAFDSKLGELHSIEFMEEDFTVYLDDAIATSVDSQLLKRGISKLSRAE